MGLLDWNWWMKRKKNSLFFERMRAHLQNHLSGDLCGDWEGWQRGVLSNTVGWTSSAFILSVGGEGALTGRGRWRCLFKQLLCANVFSWGSARWHPDPQALGQLSPESQSLPLWPRCDTDFPVSLCWLVNKSPDFCFCFPLVVFIEQSRGGCKDAWLNIDTGKTLLDLLFLKNFRSHKPGLTLFYALIGLPQFLRNGEF